MILTPEYLAEQEDCIKRNFEGYKKNIKDVATKLRLEVLKRFCEGIAPTLSVGSGGFEPVYIGVTDACDVHPLSGELLKNQGWKGNFKVCSCDALDYPDLSFAVAVCSEVIEHLPDLETVKKTFLELDRVACKWLVTTPCKNVHEPTHKFLFKFDDLEKLTSGLNIHIDKRGLFWYVYKNETSIFDKHP